MTSGWADEATTCQALSKKKLGSPTRTKDGGENGESNATHRDVVNRILSANRNSNFTINLFSISVTSQSLLGDSPILQGKLMIAG